MTLKSKIFHCLDQGEERLRLSKSERILPECEGPISTAKKQKKEENHRQQKKSNFMANSEYKQKKLKGRKQDMNSERLFEPRNGGLDICNTKAHP